MSVINKGRNDNQNPTDNNQANTANDDRINPDTEIKTEQQTDSVWLLIPQPIEVDGINYGPGQVKVASEEVSKITKDHPEVSKVAEPDNQHHGAKPMPKELDGPDYV